MIGNSRGTFGSEKIGVGRADQHLFSARICVCHERRNSPTRYDNFYQTIQKQAALDAKLQFEEEAQSRREHGDAEMVR